MHQIMEMVKPIEVITIEDEDEDDEAEIQQEKKIITLDDWFRWLICLINSEWWSFSYFDATLQ